MLQFSIYLNKEHNFFCSFIFTLFIFALPLIWKLWISSEFYKHQTRLILNIHFLAVAEVGENVYHAYGLLSKCYEHDENYG